MGTRRIASTSRMQPWTTTPSQRLRAACVHDQHASSTGLLNGFRDAGIVPIAAHGKHRPEAARAAAEVAEHRRKHLYDLVELVTQIGSVERHACGGLRAH